MAVTGRILLHAVMAHIPGIGQSPLIIACTTLGGAEAGLLCHDQGIDLRVCPGGEQCRQFGPADEEERESPLAGQRRFEPISVRACQGDGAVEHV